MLNNLINFFFPKTCFGCGITGSYLCKSCIKTKTVIHWDPICHVCGSRVYLGLVHKECSNKTYIDGVASVFVYDRVVKELIKSVKYNYSFDIFNELGNVMGDFWYLLSPFENPVLIPIPLHTHKFKLRGFNQAKILAKQVGSSHNIPVIDLIKRSKNTQTQVGMNKTQREVNLKSAFEITPSVASRHLPLSFNSAQDDRVKNIILIDDVYTTGTTLNECAKLIKQSYPNVKVYGFTLARAPGGLME